GRDGRTRIHAAFAGRRVRREFEGKCEGRHEGHRAPPRRRGAYAPAAVSPLPRIVRTLRHPADAGRAGEALSRRDELSERDERTKSRALYLLDGDGVPYPARQCAGRQRPSWEDSSGATGRPTTRGAAVRGAAQPVAGQARPAGASDRMAAACLIRYA